jgi:UDP-hydrolysing UDP-N-acetyl-D-glucosamine 2-epimerase
VRRRIGVVTVGRSDYGIYYPVLTLLQKEPSCDLCLIVAGGHLVKSLGSSVEEIERDGFPIAARVDFLEDDDSAEAVAVSIGRGVVELSKVYTQLKLELLLLLGDRFEMLAAAAAALPLRIPIAHMHGGELTLGAMDDAIRHAITKLSHLHFVAIDEYAHRVRQMGEETGRIFVTGSPVIDSLMQMEPIAKRDLEREIGFPLERSLLITFHPATLEHQNTSQQVGALLEALREFDLNFIFTYPNPDMGRSEIVRQVKAFVDETPRARFFQNLGHRKYHSLQGLVAAMVGNSSSGIVEAATFHLPVVNIGERQAGRFRAANIIDVVADREAIVAGLQRAITPAFRASLSGLVNPYGRGDAARQIVKILMSVNVGPELLRKKFVDLQTTETGERDRLCT